VGIGTTNPSTFFHVNGGAFIGGTSRYIEFQADASNTAYIDFHSQDVRITDYDTRILSFGGSTGAGSGQLQYIAASHYMYGNVGIGTNNPGATVDINGDLLVRGVVYQASFTVTISGTGTVLFIPNSPTHGFMYTALWLVTAHSGNSNNGGTTHSATAYASMNVNFPTLMNVFGGTSSVNYISIVTSGYGMGINTTSTLANGTYTVNMIRLV
jgi:hypothetical protein